MGSASAASVTEMDKARGSNEDESASASDFDAESEDVSEFMARRSARFESEFGDARESVCNDSVRRVSDNERQRMEAMLREAKECEVARKGRPRRAKEATMVNATV